MTSRPMRHFVFTLGGLGLLQVTAIRAFFVVSAFATACCIFECVWSLASDPKLDGSCEIHI